MKAGHLVPITKETTRSQISTHINSNTRKSALAEFADLPWSKDNQYFATAENLGRFESTALWLGTKRVRKKRSGGILTMNGEV